MTQRKNIVNKIIYMKKILLLIGSSRELFFYTGNATAEFF